MELVWEVVKRSNTRSCQYTKKDMTVSLERAGCIVEQHPTIKFLLLVHRPLTILEDPKTVREDVTGAIRVVHPRAARKFLGLQ